MSEERELIELKSEKEVADSKKPLIGIASHALNTIDFDVHFNHLYAVGHWARQHSIILLGLKGLQAAKARNKIIERAFESKCTHVLFVDADHFVPLEMLDCLLDSRDEAMVSGLVCKKGEGYPQVGWLRRPEDKKYLNVDLPLDGKLYEVAVCAFGCTLINLSKLKDLEKPYFRDTCEVAVFGELGNIRSDINICNMFRDKGHKIWIDTRVLIGHYADPRVVYPQSAQMHERIDGLTSAENCLRKGQIGFFYEER